MQLRDDIGGSRLLPACGWKGKEELCTDYRLPLDVFSFASMFQSNPTTYKNYNFRCEMICPDSLLAPLSYKGVLYNLWRKGNDVCSTVFPEMPLTFLHSTIQPNYFSTLFLLKQS